jgi:hypothetical protein
MRQCKERFAGVPRAAKENVGAVLGDWGGRFSPAAPVLSSLLLLLSFARAGLLLCSLLGC